MTNTHTTAETSETSEKVLCILTQACNNRVWWAVLALVQYDRSYAGQVYPISGVQDLVDAIHCFADWNVTKEGFLFWNRIAAAEKAALKGQRKKELRNHYKAKMMLTQNDSLEQAPEQLTRASNGFDPEDFSVAM